MKLAHKLTLGFLSTSFFLGSIGFISLSLNSKIENNAQYSLRHELIETQNFIQIYSSLQELRLNLQQFLLLKEREHTHEIEKEKTYRVFDKLIASVDNSIILVNKSLQRNILSIEPIGKNIERTQKEIKEAEKLQEFKHKLGKIREKVFQYLRFIEEGNTEGAHQILLLELDPQLAELVSPFFKEYQVDSLIQLNDRIESLEDALNKNKIITVSSTVFGLIVSLVSGILISQSISRPIQELKKSALRIGKGNLDSKVAINKQDEFGLLAQTFNQMIEGLKQTTVSKSYLDNILTSMVDSLIVISLDGTIQKVNQATLKLVRYQEKELINRNINLIWAEESLLIEDLIARGSLENGETIYLTKEKKKIPVAFSSSLLFNEQGDLEGIVCLARDITEKQSAQKALKESEERYALASRAANDGLWDWNLEINKIYFSPRWKSLLGYEEDSIGDSPDEWFKRVHPDYLDRLSQEIVAHLQNDISHFEVSYPMLHKDGTYRWMLCRGIAVQNEQGKIHRLAGSQADITRSRMAIEQLRHEALHDRLTGLPNRTFFLEELEKSLMLARQDKSYLFAVLFLDLDRFKVVNDSLGHLAGDELLIEFANRVKTCLSTEDKLARFGGDEFAILVKNVEAIGNVTKLADSIQKELDLPFKLPGREVFVSVSIGIALSTDNYEQIEDILRDADTAMYQAKALGKARYALFKPDMHLEALTALELENDLRRALERSEFQVYYQPIVRLSTRQIVGFEALIRWQHPKKGLISPAKFVPLAEETGLIVPIGWWIMEQACRQMRQWQEKYSVASFMSLSVNVSPLQLIELEHPDSCDRIKEILQKTGLEPSCLKLEITESTIIGNIEQTAFVFKQLKALGIKLSMDDFGTGYSSLSYLHRLPIDTLKIDRSFVSDISVNKENLELIQTIVNLSKSMKMDAIAEGVETAEQQAQLIKLNCEYGQGYLFSKPVNSEGAEILITTMEQIHRWSSLSEFCFNGSSTLKSV